MYEQPACEEPAISESATVDALNLCHPKRVEQWLQNKAILSNHFLSPSSPLPSPIPLPLCFKRPAALTHPL